MHDYLSLSKQYNFYNRYHKNAINRGIHIICIPLLVWTGSVFFSYIDLDEQFTKICIFCNKYQLFPILPIYQQYFLFGIVKFNGSSLMAIFLYFYYIILDLRLGIIMYFILYSVQISSYYFYLYVANAWLKALILHIFSWVFQIVGHIVFEKNQPAFRDGLIQSFLTAPIFILIELKEIMSL